MKRGKKLRRAAEESTGEGETIAELADAAEESAGEAITLFSSSASKQSSRMARPTQASSRPVLQTQALESTSFVDLGVEDWLIATCKSLGMRKPTPVQRSCIPAILAGKDVLGSAPTGSGKTAAFAIPVLQRLAQDTYGIYCLTLTPTRELAQQIADQFRAIGSHIAVRDCLVIGGTDMMKQAQQLQKKPHVVVGTPGRLLDHLRSSSEISIKKIKFLVLDEADRLLDFPEMPEIMEYVPPRRQTLVFSATVTASIKQLQEMLAKDSFFEWGTELGETTVDSCKQLYCFMPSTVKDSYLAHVLEARSDEQVIVFVRTCKSCQQIMIMLNELGVSATALHSKQAQRQRNSALQKFKASISRVLVATDVASRGLDIPAVTLVLNYDIPSNPTDYVHRVGRTARAGRQGTAVSLVTQYDVNLVHRIEQHIGKQLDINELDEAVVLENLSEVSNAKRVARLRVMEAGEKDKWMARRNKSATTQDAEHNTTQSDRSYKRKKSSKLDDM